MFRRNHEYVSIAHVTPNIQMEKFMHTFLIKLYITSASESEKSTFVSPDIF